MHQKNKHVICISPRKEDKITENELQKLPYRVILHCLELYSLNIISTRILKNIKSSRSKFSYFYGFFKMDRTRKLFVIFPSVFLIAYHLRYIPFTCKYVEVARRIILEKLGKRDSMKLFASVVSLRGVSFQKNEFFCNIVKNGRLKKIQSLSASFKEDINENVLNSINSLKYLRFLSIDNSFVKSTTIFSNGIEFSLPELKELVLFKCLLGNSNFMENIDNYKELQTLEVIYCEVSLKTMQCIIKMEKLRNLKIRCCKFLFTESESSLGILLFNKISLRKLYFELNYFLNRNDFKTSSNCEYFVGLKIERISFSGSKISTGFLGQICKNLKYLKVLDLSNCEISVNQIEFLKKNLNWNDKTVFLHGNFSEGVKKIKRSILESIKEKFHNFRIVF